MGQPLPVNKPPLVVHELSPGEALPPGQFAVRLQAYKIWRDELIEAIQAYQAWVEEQNLTDGQQDLRVYDLIQELQTDKLTVALTAEFARGKTELLNAIFFADFKQRLLPSGPGRTTMCPTELQYDDKDGPCIRLLPIETRKTALSIREYKRTPIHWTTIHILKANSADEVREAFLEVTRTRQVPIREAQELGLYTQDHSADASRDSMVEIPVWRHAIINYPHPLLKQGLVVLDTPGLNALGTEPELTLSMLPNAQAVIFVLGIDTGVTRSDLEVWTQHVQGARRKGHLVVLNKIDTLWGGLQDKPSIATEIARQVETVARTLSIDTRQVFPVSAQKALLGKIKSDPALVADSGIAMLESHLSEQLIPARHAIMRDRVVHEMSLRVESSSALLQTKITAYQAQAKQLRQLGESNLDAIHTLVTQVRAEKQGYDKELEGFELTRAALIDEANRLLSFVNLNSVDALIQDTRQAMQESWTTHGLQTGMRTFFQGATERMQKVNRAAEQIRKKVTAIYDRMHTEYGLARINPPPLSLAAHYHEFMKLEEKAEEFRTSAGTFMTEQHFVIKKFFITLVSQARLNFQGCNESAKGWFKISVSPVFLQVQQHRADIERKLETLKKIHADMDTLGAQLAGVEQEKKTLERHLHTVDQLLVRIQKPFE
jgi:hypothetical protein